MFNKTKLTFGKIRDVHTKKERILKTFDHEKGSLRNNYINCHIMTTYEISLKHMYKISRKVNTIYI